MCGIAGIFTPDGGLHLSGEILEKMAEALIHRGPDDDGMMQDTGCGFAFRRLAIMDPAGGRQPFQSEDGRFSWMVNGEIFNYPELKSELLTKGYHLKTGSDAEVIGPLYREEGPEFVRRLNGQFAIAIWDHVRSRLFLARDPAGIAPLFYTRTKGGLVFASEIKGILRHPDVETGLDLTGLDQVMVFPGIVSPRTLFRGIRAVQPGHYLVLEGSGFRDVEYWDLLFPEMEQDARDTPVACPKDWVAAFGDLFEQSVRRRLQSDVPVGFYLSGGLDSSLVARHIHQADPMACRDAFSITFADQRIDESRFQKAMAGAVHCHHHETPFDWPDIENRLKMAVWHGETPLKESYNTCSLALSSAVKDRGLKVILTGEGADELFAGYVGYRMDLAGGRHNGHFSGDMGFTDFLEEEIRERLWGDPDFFYERDYAPLREIREMLYAPDLRDSLWEFDATEHPVIDPEKIRNRHPLHKRSYVDFKLRLADHLLADHGDRVAFAHSVEARYPFLDPAIIDFATTLPPGLLVKDGVEKYLLKQYAGGLLPPEIVHREKFAFVAPGSPYLIRQKVPWVMDLLSEESIRRQGVFDPHVVTRQVARCLEDATFSVNTTFEADFLMIVLTYQIFSECFGSHLSF